MDVLFGTPLAVNPETEEELIGKLDWSISVFQCPVHIPALDQLLNLCYVFLELCEHSQHLES
jgi:hypothetical protein